MVVAVVILVALLMLAVRESCWMYRFHHCFRSGGFGCRRRRRRRDMRQTDEFGRYASLCWLRKGIAELRPNVWKRRVSR